MWIFIYILEEIVYIIYMLASLGIYHDCVCIQNYMFIKKNIELYMWGSKIWARDLGPGTTFHQQYVRGEEITEDRCN